MNTKEIIHFYRGQFNLTPILVAESTKGLCAILFGENIEELQSRFPQAILVQTKENLFLKTQNLTYPLDLRGTDFQKEVWMALLEIPAGKTASYSDIAIKIGKPKSARAVALACGANHLAIRVPCHRIVRKDGTISGYRWGVEQKKHLLQQELNQLLDITYSRD